MPKILSALLFTLVAVLVVIALDLWGAYGFWPMFWIVVGCWAGVWTVIGGAIWVARLILKKTGYL